MYRAILSTLLISLPLLAADQVVLTNGDIITGTIVKKDGPRLVIKSDLMGEVSMPWTAVKTIRGDSEVFVQLTDQETIKGKIESTVDELKVITATGVRTAPPGEVTAIRDEGAQRAFERLQHPRILDLWNGYFDVGLALARGNARTDTLTTAFNATRATSSDSLNVHMNQIYGTARVDNISSTIASAIRGGWKYNRNFNPRFFFSFINDYERDRFQNLDLRVIAGTGAGYRVFRRENFNLDIALGANWDRETFMNGLHRNFAEANYGNTVKYKVSKSFALTQSFQSFHNLSETGAYRMAFDLGTVTTIKRWLGWQVTASDRFQSNPVFGKQRNDLLLSTGFRLTFAH